MAAQLYRWSICIALGTAIAAGCGSSTPHEDGPISEAGTDRDADRDRDATVEETADANDAAPDAASSDAGQLDPDAGTDACACDAEPCGAHGHCLCDGRAAFCLCDTGHSGDDCQSCADGYGELATGACARSLDDSLPEPAGDHCEYAGVRHDVGLDADGDGALDETEVVSTEYVCNDAPAPQPPAPCTADTCNGHGTCADTAAGPDCDCDPGYAGDVCDVCAIGYVHSSPNGDCIVPQTLELEQPEPFGDHCDVGGIVTSRGADLDDDGTLDAGEVTVRTYDCATRNVRGGDVLVTNQAQLDALFGVNQIIGTLRIETQYVQDLSPLAALVEVGALVVNNNSSITSLAGLHHLRVASNGITLQNNAALVDVAALSAVTSSGPIAVRYNNALTSLGNLASLSQLNGGLLISDNSALVEIAGFNALLSITGNLTIRANAQLERIVGFEALHAVGTYVLIADNAALEELTAFGALTDVESLELEHNVALTTLQAFGALTTVRRVLSVRGHAVLQTLDGFPALRVVDHSLVIDGNSGLTTLGGFGALEVVGYGLSISNNPALIEIHGFDALAEVGPSFLNPPPNPFPGPTPTCTLPVCPTLDEVAISGNTALVSLAGFSSVTQLEPLLRIDANPALLQITAFEALSEAEAVAIFDLATLASLDGFGMLEHIGSLQVAQLPSLVSLTGFGALEGAGDLLLFELPALAALDTFAALRGAWRVEIAATGLQTFDLPALASVGGWLLIHGNPNLSALDHAFAALEHARVDGDEVDIGIYDNPNLETIHILSGLRDADIVFIQDAPAPAIRGFESLERITSLELRDNPSLQQLPSLPADAFVGRLSLLRNDALTNLDGLQSLNHIYGLELLANATFSDFTGYSGTVDRVTIQDNPTLPTCRAQQFATAINATSITISGNSAVPCN